MTGPHNLGFICFLLNVTYNSCRNVYLPNATFSARVIYSPLFVSQEKGRLLLAFGSIMESNTVAPRFHLHHTAGGLGCAHLSLSSKAHSPPLPASCPSHPGCRLNSTQKPEFCSLPKEQPTSKVNCIIMRPWERQKSILWMQCPFQIESIP